MDVAKMTIISSDLMKIPAAIHLSKQTVSTIKQNLFWAFIYNIVLIPVAALGLLNPLLAGTAMAFSSITVVLNSLRMRRFS
jgi:Cu2+-exporting ATPase